MLKFFIAYNNQPAKPSTIYVDGMNNRVDDAMDDIKAQAKYLLSHSEHAGIHITRANRDALEIVKLLASIYGFDYTNYVYRNFTSKDRNFMANGHGVQLLSQQNLIVDANPRTWIDYLKALRKRLDEHMKVSA